MNHWLCWPLTWWRLHYLFAIRPSNSERSWPCWWWCCHWAILDIRVCIHTFLSIYVIAFRFQTRNWGDNPCWASSYDTLQSSSQKWCQHANKTCAIAPFFSQRVFQILYSFKKKIAGVKVWTCWCLHLHVAVFELQVGICLHIFKASRSQVWAISTIGAARAQPALKLGSRHGISARCYNGKNMPLLKAFCCFSWALTFLHCYAIVVSASYLFLCSNPWIARRTWPFWMMPWRPRLYSF